MHARTGEISKWVTTEIILWFVWSVIFQARLLRKLVVSRLQISSPWYRGMCLNLQCSLHTHTHPVISILVVHCSVRKRNLTLFEIGSALLHHVQMLFKGSVLLICSPVSRLCIYTVRRLFILHAAIFIPHCKYWNSCVRWMKASYYVGEVCEPLLPRPVALLSHHFWRPFLLESVAGQ